MNGCSLHSLLASGNFYMRLKISILFVARSLGLFALSRYVSNDHVRVLCYHGGCVGDEYQYNSKLFTSQAHFRERLDWMQAAGFRFISLDEATDIDKGQPADQPRVVITFDDGWHTTATCLLPVLAERQIPSTLYLCTKHFLEGWPVPTVSVHYILWKTGQDTAVLKGLCSDLDGEYDLRNAHERKQLITRAIGFVKTKHSRAEVCDALESFALCLGISPSQLDLASRRFEYASREEIQAASSACAIEAHGHVHSYPAGAPDRFAEDLRRCSDEIAALGLPRPRHYCYPSGSHDEAAAGVLHQNGMKSATTCAAGLMEVGKRDSYYYLPRFLDGESVHQIEFEAEMSGFSELVRARLLRPLTVVREQGLMVLARRWLQRQPHAADAVQ